MSEYIIELDSKRSIALMLALAEEARGGDAIRGEIVRCRDCKHYDLPYCKKGECTYCSERQITDPDGYCFRGERRGE